MLPVSEVEHRLETSIHHSLLCCPEQVGQPVRAGSRQNPEDSVPIFLLVMPVRVIPQIALHFLLELIVILGAQIRFQEEVGSAFGCGKTKEGIRCYPDPLSAVLRINHLIRYKDASFVLRLKLIVILPEEKIHFGVIQSGHMNSQSELVDL